MASSSASQHAAFSLPTPLRATPCRSSFGNHHRRARTRRAAYRQSQQRVANTRVRMCLPETPDAAAKPDIIERMYEFFFGPKQKSPFGLARFDRDRFPELYPATLTEFAAPVSSDDAQCAKFRALLARTQLETRPLQLLFQASRDGWCAAKFHSKVDKKGACVVLVETQGGALCGGYAPKGFVGYGESRGSVAAFLFTWPDGDHGKAAQKLRKIGGPALAVLDEPDCGPRFGADSLFVPLRPPRATWEDCEQDRKAMSKLGSYYERLSDGGKCLFAENECGKGTTLKDMWVYAGVYADDEQIPFDDALPFALE